MEVNVETASEILPMLGGRAGGGAGTGSDDRGGDPTHDGEDARLIVTAGGAGTGSRGSSFDDGMVSLPAGPFTSALLDGGGGGGEGDGQEMGRTPAWNITLNSIMYMAVPLSMPATLAAAGWLWGSLWFVYCTAATYWTGLIIGRVFNAHPTLTTYPAMAAEAFAQLYETRSTRNSASGDGAGSGTGRGGGRDIERLANGWRVFGRRLVVVMQFVTFYLDTVTQMIYVAQYFGQLLPGSKICQWAWLLIVWGISVPVMQIPTFHASRWVVVPAMVTLSLSVLFFLGEVAVVAPWNCQPGPGYGGVTTRSIFVSLASFAYAYGGHGMFPEELREMKEPKKWPQVMNWSYAVMAPCYLVCMSVGYYAYGDFAQANINLNFPNNWVNTVSITLQLLQCYYLIFYTNVVLVMGLEMDVGVDPTTTWSPPVRWAGGLSPVWVRLLIRTLFLGSQVFLAEVFLGGSGDIILDLQSLTGAVGMAGMTFFLPSVLALALLPPGELGWLETAWCHVNFWIGVGIAVAGVWTSVLDLTEDATGEMGGACKLEYTYAPYDPGDPCYVSGIPGIGGGGGPGR